MYTLKPFRAVLHFLAPNVHEWLRNVRRRTGTVYAVYEVHGVFSVSAVYEVSAVLTVLTVFILSDFKLNSLPHTKR